MNHTLLNLLVGIVSAVVAVVILQASPSRYKWSTDISLAEGQPSGRPVYQVKLFRRRRRVWKGRRLPMDLTFNARVAVEGLGHRRNTEKIVPIPVTKSWRPVVAQSVLLSLLPEKCSADDLRYFPEDIREKCRLGTLTLEDLLSTGTTATLRVYVFAYRPYVGTRWMIRGRYTSPAIKPGRFAEGRGTVEVSTDGKPPEVDDLFVHEPALDHLSSPEDSTSSDEVTSPWISLRIGQAEITVCTKSREGTTRK